jgi:hypothetical protein
MIVALAACSVTEPTLTPPRLHKSLADDPVVINGYEVRFLGRQFTDGETSFSYSVLPTEEASPLERFFIEVPDGLADPVSFHPPYGRLEELSKFGGLYGVIWRGENAGAALTTVPEIPDSVFSVTFAGNVGLGTVQALVGADLAYAAGPVAGAGVGYNVSGTVFVDTDRDGLQDPATEPGLPDIVVELVDEFGMTATAVTDSAGAWQGLATGGTLTVRIDLENYPEAGNAALADYYTPTTPLSYVLDLEGDVTGIDFGFAPLTTEIISAIETGALPSNGEDRKFWRAQFKRALVRAHRPEDNGVGMPQVYAEEELLAFVEEIRGLFYDDPYVFTPGRELREVYNILQFRPGNLIEELRQELLVTELNHVARLGLWDANPRFQADIIGWGESVVIQETAAAADKGAIELQQAIDTFEAINTGGGGIIDD